MRLYFLANDFEYWGITFREDKLPVLLNVLFQPLSRKLRMRRMERTLRGDTPMNTMSPESTKATVYLLRNDRRSKQCLGCFDITIVCLRAPRCLIGEELFIRTCDNIICVKVHN